MSKEVCPTCGRREADLTITDVPEQTLKQFKEYANKFFKPKDGTAHYGFSLKWLMDFYLGVIGGGHERAENLAQEALSQISEIKEEVRTKFSQKQEEKKIIKTVDGKELRIG